jgi:hypothetical protein
MLRSPSLWRPVSRRVHHSEDVNPLWLDAIDDDIRQRGHHQFTSVLRLPYASAVREPFQRPCCLVEFPDGRLSQRSVMLAQVSADAFQIFCRCRRPAHSSQDLSIRSTRASISSSSMNSPRSIWSTPTCTCPLNQSLYASKRATASCSRSSVPRPVIAASSLS